jgi:hypothetical protein
MEIEGKMTNRLEGIFTKEEFWEVVRVVDREMKGEKGGIS